MNRHAWLPKIRIMLLVLVCAGVLILVLGGPSWYNARLNHARESVLKNDLQAMREAIHKYTVDNQRPPESLQILVDQHYLRFVPANPITKKPDWVPHNVNVDSGGGKTLVGIDDVHASPGQVDRNGVPYCNW